MDEEIKLDMEQRARAVQLETQAIDDPEWAAEAIVWQRDRIEELEAERERLQSAIRVFVNYGEAVRPASDFRGCWNDRLNATIREAFAEIEVGRRGE